MAKDLHITIAQPKDLTALSDKELQEQTKTLNAEIERRRQTQVSRAYENRLLHNRDVFKNIEALIALAKDHDRTSCSDSVPSNSAGKCTRCTLLDIRHCGYMDSRFVLRIAIELEELEEPKK